jgi:predicted peroxiredoxin
MKLADHINNDLFNTEDRNNLTTSKKSKKKSLESKHPDPKKHKIISFIKSGVRILACAIGFAGNLEIGFLLLGLAEIVGVYEEMV